MEISLRLFAREGDKLADLKAYVGTLPPPTKTEYTREIYWTGDDNGHHLKLVELVAR